VNTEITIIGGGITGLTTALLLARAGRKVVVVEARNIGDCDTGYTSGNLYAMVSPYYRTLLDKFDAEILTKIASERLRAIEFIREISQEYGIECEYQSQPWCYYTENDDDVNKIRQEVAAGQKVGLQTKFIENVPLPFSTMVKAGCMLENQARFNAQQYVSGLAQVLAQEPNCTIFEHSRVIEWNDKGTCTVKTESGGEITSEKIVMATHTPIGVYFLHTLVAPYRSYVVAARLHSNNYPRGAYWDTSTPYHHSASTHSGKEGDLLLIVGAGHKVGQKENMLESYLELEKYANARYDIQKFEYRWSAQHYRPSDGLPYIGLMENSNTYVATGYHADGLVYGTVASRMLADAITGKKHQLSDILSPNRHNPVAAAKDFLKENIDAAVHAVKDYFSAKDAESINEIKPGEGKIVEVNGSESAVYRDDSGELHILDRKCTHMGCVVHWNNAERSWDCQCHGSRFSCTGDVLEGPAVKPLERKAVKQ
jgi:glycine/D-amino acid oxidase-like deaminating enzyme/nitrite reductase/ring-hydroxylating ferredoxin subunit